MKIGERTVNRRKRAHLCKINSSSSDIFTQDVNSIINKQNNVKGINERTKIKCNGEEIIDGKIKLEKSGKIYNIEAFI